MKPVTSAAEILKVFAMYGFRKASMGDIAKAANLSRQSIYNQFGSKEAVLDWAIAQFLEDGTDRVLAHLTDAEGAPEDVLNEVFRMWIGDHVPLLRGTPHGLELLETAMEAAAADTRDHGGAFFRAIERYLKTSGLVGTEEEARDRAFVLHVASKGLLLKSETSDAFAEGMGRVIATLFR